MTDEPKSPIVTAQSKAKVELPRRFYTEAAAQAHERGFAVALDGRVARTPAGKPLALTERSIVEALAAEWQAQGEHIDPATMPLTRLVNAAIDRVAAEMEAVRAEIVKYAGSDLLCYRAEGPQSLVAAQERAWNPLIAWAKDELGARFVLAEGIVHTPQPETTIAAMHQALAGFGALSLAAIHMITTLTGSAILALAVGRGELSAADAWAAAYVDEDWQMAQWGRDETALAQRAARYADLLAAASVLGPGPG